MSCPQCGAEYGEAIADCPECGARLTDAETVIDTWAGAGDLDSLIRTGLKDPVAIGLARSLLQQAEIPFFAMDQNAAARQESGNVFGFWSIRVPQNKEFEAREIVRSVEAMGS